MENYCKKSNVSCEQSKQLHGSWFVGGANTNFIKKIFDFEKEPRWRS